MVHEDGRHEDRRLAAYLGSELGPADVEAVEAHLLDCDGCWQAVHEARRGRALGEAMRELAPASLRDRVRKEHPRRRATADAAVGAVPRWLWPLWRSSAGWSGPVPAAENPIQHP